MSGVYEAICLAELVLIVPLLLRVLRGPTVSDRIVALNAIATQASLAVILFAAFAQRTVYLDVAIWLSSFSYLATIVWARYLERELL